MFQIGLIPRIDADKGGYKLYNVCCTLLDLCEGKYNLTRNKDFVWQKLNEDGEWIDMSKWFNIHGDYYEDKQRYIPDKHMRVEINITATALSCFEKLPNTDITLKVENVELFLNKKNLWLNSNNFKDNSKKVEDGIIEIEDVTLVDFLMFLLLIDKNTFKYPYLSIILGRGEFDKYLEIANRFKAKIVHSDITSAICFMLESKSTKKFDFWEFRKNCIKFADKYQHWNVLDHCLDSFETAQEIRKVSGDEEFQHLSSETRSRILARHLALEK